MTYHFTLLLVISTSTICFQGIELQTYLHDRIIFFAKTVYVLSRPWKSAELKMKVFYTVIFLFQIYKDLTMNSTPNLPMGLFYSLLVTVIFEKQLLHAAPSESRANHRENGIEQGTSHSRGSFRTIRSTDENEPLENEVTLRVRDLPW